MSAVMKFGEALEKYAKGKIDDGPYAEAWLEEVKLCFDRHSDSGLGMIRFVSPCHWEFSVHEPTGTMFGKSLGSITIPAFIVPPETAALALIAYLGVTASQNKGDAG